MRQCSKHPQAIAGYVCIFRECPTIKNQQNLLCHECYFQNSQENPHHEHIDRCLSVLNLLNEFQNHVNMISNKEKLLYQYISQCQSLLVNLTKKRVFFNELFDELNQYMTGTVNRLQPSIMSKLEQVAMKPLQYAFEDSEQIFSEHFAENQVICSCDDEQQKSVNFLCLEKNIPMEERTRCCDCHNDKQRNISIEDAKPIIQRAEQEEMYFNGIQRVNKEKLAVENLMAEAFSKLDIVSNYKSMFFNKAFTTQFRKSRPTIIAEFLSNYKQTSEEKYDYRELTEVFSNLQNVHRHLKELNEFLSNHDVLQKRFNYTIICEIYWKNEFVENKILVVHQDNLVRHFIGLIIQLCPYLRETGKIHLNNFDLKTIENQLLQSIIINQSSIPLVKLIYF